MSSRAAAAGRRPPDPRGGFTLAEVIVALALLTWGALALVAASARAIQLVAAAEGEERAALAARDRVEQLASLDCSALRDGGFADSTWGRREWWTVGQTRSGFRLATDSVAYGDRGRTRSIVLSRLVQC